MNRLAGDQPPDDGHMFAHVEMKIACLPVMQSPEDVKGKDVPLVPLVVLDGWARFNDFGAQRCGGPLLPQPQVFQDAADDWQAL